MKKKLRTFMILAALLPTVALQAANSGATTAMPRPDNETADTACTPKALPYTTGFEEGELYGTASEVAIPLCSHRYTSPNAMGAGLKNPYAASQSASYAHSGSRYLMFNGNSNPTATATWPDTAALILPQIDVATYPMNGNQVTFWARRTVSTSKNLYVGTMSDPTNISTLTVVDSVAISGNTHTKYTVSLSGANATDAYVVLFMRKGNSSTYIDDLSIEARPLCGDIEGLHVVESLTSTTSLTLSWNDSEADSYKVYSISPSDTVLLASALTDTFFTATGLTPYTTYTFAVYGQCDSTLSHPALTSGRTLYACPTITAPYTWTFEDMEINNNPLCWARLGDGAAVVVDNSFDRAHEGGQYVRFTAGTNNILILPEVATSITNLQLKFWTRPAICDNDSSGTFSVGYMTDITDASTFVALDTYNANDFDTTYQQKSTMYNRAPANARMAMRHTSAQLTWGWWYVDDVTIDSLPSCIPPSELSVSDLISTEAILNWSGNANSYTLYSIDGLDTVILQTTTDTFYYIYGLNPNTQYTYGVSSNCGLTSSDIRTITFTTPCAPIVTPYTETFEPNSPQQGCWDLQGDIEWTFTQGDYSEQTGAFEGNTNALALANNRTAEAMLISPLINTNGAAALKLKFAHIQRIWGVDIDELRVKYLPAGSTEWSTAATYTDTVSTWTVDEVVLPGNTQRIAFAFKSNYGYGVGIDSVVFTASEEDYCFPVSGLRVVDDLTSSDSVVLRWSGTGLSVSILDMDSNTVLASNVTDSFFVVRNLTANTNYTFGVKVNCGESESDVVSVSVRTLCGTYTAPHTWTFEPETTNFAPHCWETVSGIVTVGTGSTHDGSHNLSFTSSTNGIILLPAFTDATNTLQMSLWLRPGNNTSGSGTFHVGYMTNPADATTFTALATYSYSEFAVTGTMEFGQRTVSFANAPDSARIALRATPVATIYKWMVDDVEVLAIPDCMPVEELAVMDSLTTQESVTLTWESTASNFIIFNTADTSMTYTTSNTTITIPDLDANTTYTFGVVTDCSSEMSDTVTITVHTACEAIAIPYTENFDAGGNYACWHLVNAAPMTGVSEYSPYNDSLSFRFVYSTNPPQYLISPELTGTDDGVRVSLMYKTADFPESFALGYSTTTNEPSAFVWGTEQTELTNTEYLPYSAIFSTPNIKYIAIKYTANNMMYLYIDSLVISEIPSCLPVEGLAVDSVSESTVSLSWSGNAASYTVMNGSTQVATGITETHYTVVNLAGGTEYNFSVVANCSATDNSEPMTIRATTLQVDTLQVIFAVNDATMGTTNPAPGTYSYASGDTVSFTAIPNSGYAFKGWLLQAGGSTDTLDADFQTAGVPANTWMNFGTVTVTALFEAASVVNYYLNIRPNDETMGTVEGGGQYAAGTTVTIEAHAFDGYRFVRWSDGITEAVRNVTVNSDISLVAYFESAVGIDEVASGKSVVSTFENRIIVTGAEQQDIRIYAVDGRCVRTQRSAEATAEFTMEADGVYLVKVGQQPAKRVVIVR